MYFAFNNIISADNNIYSAMGFFSLWKEQEQQALFLEKMARV